MQSNKQGSVITDVTGQLGLLSGRLTGTGSLFGTLGLLSVSEGPLTGIVSVLGLFCRPSPEMMFGTNRLGGALGLRSDSVVLEKIL